MTKFLRVVWAIILTLSSLSVGAPPVQAKSSADCDTIQFIFARGSGEELNGPSNQAWEREINRQFSGTQLKYSFYELGSQKQGVTKYPAVAVGDSMDGFGNLLGAFVSGGETFDFGNSVVEGSNELQYYISEYSRTCPDTKFVLGGYSQGAMVISGTLDQLDADKIAYVATFGDPKLYLPEGEGRWPEACRGRGFSNYRAHVSDCRAYEGVLGSYRPYQPADYWNKIGTWCNEKDIMCSSGTNLSDHTAYDVNGLYTEAAQKIAIALQDYYPVPGDADNRNPWAASSHDVAFLFDRTLSMEPLVDVYKAEAIALAEEVIAEGGRIALYTYGDLADSNTTLSAYQYCDFTCTLADFKKAIYGLRMVGGGDPPESALSASLFVLNTLDWRQGATKSLSIITDAGYHNPDRDDTTLDMVVQRSLEIDPVNFYIMTDSRTKPEYQELARRTNGGVFDVYSSNERQASTEAILRRPEALLSQPEYYGRIGDDFTFDASNSAATDGATMTYEWDLDGDGEFELKNTGPVVHRTYSEALETFIQVKMTDGEGHSSTMSAKLSVVEDDDLPTIKTLTSHPLSKASTRIDFTTDAARVLLVVDDVYLGYFDPGTTTSFTLTDLAIGATIRLIPCDSDGQKGVARELTFVLSLPKVPNTGVAP